MITDPSFSKQYRHLNKHPYFSQNYADLHARPFPNSVLPLRVSQLCFYTNMAIAM
ncbi:hypothetical protein CPS_2026 [Colwellia psychrerythraea 34H]|uniref:Uncharacterized protein n=1 Tax=Colwellia psychrerythraea (strain 34H / ATCC BAA-681) TaxID=167879 RepID=Q483L2_COLP3|nr:hypothetical protein CPS_2026 [Colwellia psychrerythraea 34H]